MQVKIKLNNINDVILFIEKTNNYQYCDGDYIYQNQIVDFRSFMEIISIGLDKECVVNFLSDDEKLCNQFKEDIKLWIVEED